MRPPEAAFGRERPAKYATESSPILLLAEAEIRKLAIELHGTLDSVDILLNIVGGIYARGEPTTDGVEKTLALNHLAPCLLTTLLLDPVRAAPRGQRRTLPEIEVTPGNAEHRTTAERNVDEREDGPHHGGDEWTRVGHGPATSGTWCGSRDGGT